MNKDKIEASQMILKNFVDDMGKQITYYRPSQVREIPLKQGSIRGYIPSLKPNLRGCVWNYESQLERDFLYLLDHDYNCIDLQTQPCHISYTTKKGAIVNATPDVWAIFRDGRQFLFEVKKNQKKKKKKKNQLWMVRGSLSAACRVKILAH
ncbi:MAG: hypothetical protein ACTSYI_08835 [Promethearchaeota archaeon]